MVNVTSGPTPDAASAGIHFQSPDRRTGALLPMVATGGVMEALLRLHSEMFAGVAGAFLLECHGNWCSSPLCSRAR